MIDRDGPEELPLFDILDNVFLDVAEYRVRFDRDQSDGFSLNTDRVGNSFKKLDELPEDYVLSLLPNGSHWEQAEGWRSFFGVPCRLSDQLWLFFGATKVLDHPSRGAYPVTRIFLLNFDDNTFEDAFSQLIERIQPDVQESKGARPSYGAVIGDASSPEEHEQWEAWILRRALRAYRDSHLLFFRTALLSENELPALNLMNYFKTDSGSETSPFTFGRSLYGTVPEIHGDFSWSSKLQIFLELELL